MDTSPAKRLAHAVRVWAALSHSHFPHQCQPSSYSSVVGGATFESNACDPSFRTFNLDALRRRRDGQIAGMRPTFSNSRGQRFISGKHGVGEAGEGEKGLAGDDAQGGAGAARTGGGGGEEEGQTHPASGAGGHAAFLAKSEDTGTPAPLQEKLESTTKAAESDDQMPGGQHTIDEKPDTRRAVKVFLRQKMKPAVENLISYFNDQSGWTEVNRLKNEISELEDRLAKSQAAYKQARRSHSTTQDEYHRIQQEINSLSSSKNTWTDDQFRYFQNLLASDRLISNKLTVLDAQTREQEHAVDTGLRELMEGLGRRFHEEQLWTDRVRMLSVWSTVAILTVNSLIFLVTFLVRSRESSYIRGVLEELRGEMRSSKERGEEAAPAALQLASVADRLAEERLTEERHQHTHAAAPENRKDASGRKAASRPQRTGGMGGPGGRGGLGEGGRRAAAAWYAVASLMAGFYLGRLGSVP